MKTGEANKKKKVSAITRSHKSNKVDPAFKEFMSSAFCVCVCVCVSPVAKTCARRVHALIRSVRLHFTQKSIMWSLVAQ